MSDAARYAVGALLAVASGAVLNLGVLIQKKAVNLVPADGANLMARLIRDRKWVGGLLLQFVVGTPMYAAAQIFIGPALIPGLMATGLVVLALGSPLVAGESLRTRDFVAVGIVVVAVALFGLSRLSIDLGKVDVLAGTLALRFVGMTVAASVLAAVLYLLSGIRAGWRGNLVILASGLLYALGNLWLGATMGALSRIVEGGRATALIAGGAAALAVVIATNVVSMVWTQTAFQHGKAATLMPLQQVPIQIVPAVSYFAVFLMSPPAPSSPFLVVAGVALIVAGSTILGSGGADRGTGGAARH
jgi:hypothetical protein